MVRTSVASVSFNQLSACISDFNYVRNANDECVLVPGTEPLLNDDSCKNGDQYWYERTAYRLIPYSSCEGGDRPDRGPRHVCPGFGAHGAWFWLFIILIPFAFTALVGYYYYRRSGLKRGLVFWLHCRSFACIDRIFQQHSFTWRWGDLVWSRLRHYGNAGFGSVVCYWPGGYCMGVGCYTDG